MACHLVHSWVTAGHVRVTLLCQRLRPPGWQMVASWLCGWWSGASFVLWMLVFASARIATHPVLFPALARCRIIAPKLVEWMTTDGLVTYLHCGLLFVLAFDEVGYHQLELVEGASFWWQYEIPQVDGVPETSGASQLG